MKKPLKSNECKRDLTKDAQRIKIQNQDQKSVLKEPQKNLKK
jgi:hypothetical protein